MRIASFNINGVKARLPRLIEWLEERRPTVACLQEVKSVDDAFPAEPIEELGYNIAVHGQKGFNGVALLSKLPLEDVQRGLPGADDDEQARFITGLVATEGGVVRIASAYMPNGNPIGTDKFAYKLAWLKRMEDWARAELAHEEPLVIAGDFNIIPERIDATFPEKWTNDALFRPESLQRFRTLVNLGLTDAVHAVTVEPSYTFWDFKTFGWERKEGIRIDHLLLSPQLADRLEGVRVHAEVRGGERPSDHVPVEGTFAI